jgi:hypothetical protein
MIPLPTVSPSQHASYNEFLTALDTALGAAQDVVNYFLGEGESPMDGDTYEALPERARDLIGELDFKLREFRA